MTPKSRARLVHLLTATGAAFAIAAIFAAFENAWPEMFLFLLGALAVDGADGPLARKYDVKNYAPEWDGAIMDLIIDYLTYVFIPALAVAKGLIPGHLGTAIAVIIAVSGVIYFSDTRMKTKDYSFRGFPGCFNMIVVVLFILSPPVWISVLLLLAASAAQFAPVKFIHPVRTKRWRKLSLPIMLIWSACVLWGCIANFNPPLICSVVLVATSLWLLFAGAVQQLSDPL
ncbi:CDP-alcohol phosphatidyltransferase family protein [Paracoccaceae bacterium GXU_MW_L88]